MDRNKKGRKGMRTEFDMAASEKDVVGEKKTTKKVRERNRHRNLRGANFRLQLLSGLEVVVDSVIEGARRPEKESVQKVRGVGRHRKVRGEGGCTWKEWKHGTSSKGRNCRSRKSPKHLDKTREKASNRKKEKRHLNSASEKKMKGALGSARACESLSIKPGRRT